MILGGYGETGRRLARLVVKHLGADVIVAGRDGSRANALADELNAGGFRGHAEGLRVDATKPGDVRLALTGVDLFCHTGPAFEKDATQALANAVLESQTDWLDVQLSPIQSGVLKGMDPEIRQAGRCFSIQAGFHPGMAALLVRWAAEQLDAVSSAVVASYLNPKGGIPYTSGVDELVEMFRDYTVHRFEDGRWIESSGAKKGDYRKFEFPFGLGKTTCVAMDLEEMMALPGMIAGLQETAFFIGGGDPITNWMVSPVVMAGLKLLPFMPLRFWGRLYVGSMRLFSRPPYGTALLLEAAGTNAGGPATVRLAIQHRDAYDLTAIPAAAVMRQVLDGSAHRPGVHYSAHLPIPAVMLAAMESMGVEIINLTEEA
jgi:saccharopine dehydrogenase (NAD+, L-lysine-forming)